MKNFKKIVTMLLAFAMVITLAACGNQGEESKPESEAPAASGESGAASSGKTYEIGVTIYQFSDNFMTSYKNELTKYFEEKAKATGDTYNVEFQDGKNDQATQTEQLSNFIAQKKDLIIANLVDPTGADQVIQNAKQAGIPVIMINREPSTETMQLWPGKTTYVGVDARQSGIYQGEIIAELANKGDLNGDGKVSYLMIQGDAGNVDAEQRTQYSIETLEKTIKTNKLDIQRGNWDQAKGQEIAANALSKHGKDLEVIFSNNDAMALGATQAIEGAGRKVNEDIYIVGVDALPEAIEKIVAGKFTGTVLNDAFNQAQTAGDVALELLSGKDVKPYYWHDYVKVTKEEDAKISRKEARPETMEEYKARMKDAYGIE